jgi:hypothetical protein
LDIDAIHAEMSKRGVTAMAAPAQIILTSLRVEMIGKLRWANRICLTSQRAHAISGFVTVAEQQALAQLVDDTLVQLSTPLFFSQLRKCIGCECSEHTPTFGDR